MIRKTSQISNGVKKILYIGRITNYKGIHQVVKAMPKVIKAYPEAVFYIRGQVSTSKKGNYHQKLSLAIAESPVNSKIRYVPGWVKETDKRRFMREADVIVCPSLCSEGFGFVPIEALKLNGIVVSSDLFQKTGTVSDKIAFVYPRKSIKQLAEQIIKALSLSARERQIRKKKAKAWTAQFTWQKHIDGLEKVFKDLRQRSSVG